MEIFLGGKEKGREKGEEGKRKMDRINISWKEGGRKREIRMDKVIPHISCTSLFHAELSLPLYTYYSYPTLLFFLQL